MDDAAKAEIVARLGLKENYLSSDRVCLSLFVSFSTNLIKLCQVVAGLSIDIASRLEEMSEQTHAPSSNTFDSRLMVCSWSVFRT